MSDNRKHPLSDDRNGDSGGQAVARRQRAILIPIWYKPGSYWIRIEIRLNGIHQTICTVQLEHWTTHTWGFSGGIPYSQKEHLKKIHEQYQVSSWNAALNFPLLLRFWIERAFSSVPVLLNSKIECRTTWSVQKRKNTPMYHSHIKCSASQRSK